MAAPPASPLREERVRELRVAFRRAFRGLSRLRGRDTHLAGGELSHAQFELLSELHERGELSAGELAGAAGLAPGTLTPMLDHVAACGHVERVRSRADRRVVVCRLTAQGRARIEAKREAWQARWEQALAGLGEEELGAAARVLSRVAEMIEQAPAERAASASPKGAFASPQGPAQAPGAQG